MADDQLRKPSWPIKNYILAALGGTLAATAIVTVVSIVLSPAHITFDITKSSSSFTNNGTTQSLNLTITATNLSRRRAAVRYQSVFVDLKNSSSASGKDAIHAQLDDAKPDAGTYFRAGSLPVDFKASAVLVVGDLAQAFAGNRESRGGFTVVVMAQVRFRVVGKLRTRLYDIRVSCKNVLFPVDGGSAPTKCTG
ncbi:hypothetical protein BRADI_1g49440v3 [Brachypodium distachyon]|uniref:Late embryogenesis abundant protein LEA-2 subgroup domain-containing protein n=1 Tax=Brachypodium distachyon TaxID=15368 RepID=I1H130_BRADI|nr:hypothetical protein BRADI_1g49440v3 [Brachypodium distachyon]